MNIFKKLKDFFSNLELNQKKPIIIVAAIILLTCVAICIPQLRKNIAVSEQTTLKDKQDNKKKTADKTEDDVCGMPIVTNEPSETQETADDSAAAEASNNPEVTPANNNPTDASANTAQSAPAQEKAQTAAPSSPAQNQTPAASNSNSSGGSSTPAAPAAPEKKWVPPVYKTVHHDAVYQTEQIVVCNYCGAEFSSTSEFQAHKEANGG